MFPRPEEDQALAGPGAVEDLWITFAFQSGFNRGAALWVSASARRWHLGSICS
jgi:hypothetical protein